MAIEVAQYQFQSWVRKGIATQISEVDVLGNPAAGLPPGERPTVPIGVSINSTAQAPKPFALIGPADIIGVHRDMVVRTEPRYGAVNFEPNYLAFIEFYDEDFPWRYSPARPDGDKLRPWLFLLVLREDEFVRDDRRLPLPVVTVKSKEALPRSDETWLFAHAHLEQPIPQTELSTLESYLKSLQETVTTDPDKLYSRLLSPRHLQPNSAYQAFLVPAFEGGRLAGLGKPTTGVSAQKPAWDGSAGAELPFYFDWSFRTGEDVDFEELVELLEPRVLNKRIGIRLMDCKKPSFVLVGPDGLLRPGGEAGLPAPNPDVQGLEGALKTDRTKPVPEQFTPNAFQDELQILVNLPETIQSNIDAPPGTDEDLLNDPVVTLAFYGQNHARQHKSDKVLLDATKDGWYHALNRDPRTRVPAAFGTMVIQKNQEKFMQRAWQQVQTVYEANRIFRSFKFIGQVSVKYSDDFFSTVSPPQLLAITAPLHAKILGSPTTILQQLRSSTLRAPVFSAAFRRITRPAGKLAQRLSQCGTPLHFSKLVDAVNSRSVDPAPAREVPVGIPSVDDLAKRIQPHGFPEWVLFLIRHRNAALTISLFVLLIAAFITGAWLVCGLVATAAVAGHRWLAAQSTRIEAAAMLTDPVRATALIASTPPRPHFNVQLEGETSPPSATPGPQPEGDSVEAANFRKAALQLSERLAIRAPEPGPLPAFDMINGYARVARAIDPKVSFPRRLSALVKIPNVTFEKPEDIVEAMAHPDFEDAMYTYLRDISKELLIPNLNLVPPNTISVLETNPKFIESYLVGLNHEMARELLWREYPTDMRGSYFRQFWEVKGISNPVTSEDAEQLKDVTKLYAWTSTSALGAHKPSPPANADVQAGEEQLVLVIRGELLKRYPNTVIYAQKAIDDGEGNRIIYEGDLSPAEFDRHIKFPLFRAEIEPDLRFFGFDLTIEKARGTVESKKFPNDQLGWFFVIQEVPGEPRFGMDIHYRPTLDSDNDPTNNKRDTWNNLAWNLFGAEEPPFVSRWPAPSFPPPGPDTTEMNQHQWGSNSAQMAYILFQTPVMVAVHASEMLDLVDENEP
jgi:hypothetical protein